MDLELGSLNRPNILKEEQIITIYIEASVLPEKEDILFDFVYRFNHEREPVAFEGEYYKLELFRRYVGGHKKKLNYNNMSIEES